MDPKNGMRPVHPGEILREELDVLGLSANGLSKALGVPVNRPRRPGSSAGCRSTRAVRSPGRLRRGSRPYRRRHSSVPLAPCPVYGNYIPYVA